MGQLASLDDFNSLTAITNTIKAVTHDCSAYVCNAAKLDSDCCSCWRFKVQTFETHPYAEKKKCLLELLGINAAFTCKRATCLFQIKRDHDALRRARGAGTVCRARGDGTCYTDAYAPTAK